ncbi:MAG TPA: serine hydrolase domain-containing protein [Ktedonobacterales bacterium]|nr:serine hydrolase domain-containing protein [Ktedonobacterales bacterium]
MPSASVIGTLKRRIPNLMAQANVPGLSLALIRNAQLAWSHGFGVANVATQEPVTTATIFEAASLSKPVFAYAALLLRANGSLTLDTPLTQYLPPEEREAPLLFDHIVNEPRVHQISLRHVLTHSTGFPNWSPEDEPLRIHFVPGERFSYSGEGFIFLQRVIERITRRPAHELMAATVFNPMGMTISSFIWNGSEQPPVAQGYNKRGRPVRKAIFPTMNAAFTLHCAPADYARFMLTVMRPPAQDSAFLHADAIDEMLTPLMPVNDNAFGGKGWPKPQIALDEHLSWGLGWGIQHHTSSAQAFWHWGNNGCFKALAVGYKHEGLGLVLMANSANAPTIWKDILVEALGGDYPALNWLGDEA